MKHFFLQVLGIFLFSFSLFAQEELPSFLKDSVDSYVNRGMTNWQVPGVAVAVVKNGKIIYTKGFGVADKLSGQKVDENTVFMIGSNTKSFTSTTLSILQEKKALKFTDKVKKWMPEFELNNSFLTEEINVADLLSHRIGFGSFQGDLLFWTSNLSRKEIVGKMKLLKPQFDLRTKWGYCNSAYASAGELTSLVTKKNWETVVEDEILKPLDMNRTFMTSSQMHDVPNIAYPHTIVKGKVTKIPMVNISNIGPAGSMCSSVKDMARWLQAQLGEGKIDGKQTIARKALLNTREAHSTVSVKPYSKDSHFELYGLGWFIKDYHGKLVYSHTGGINGYLSSMMFIPEEKLGIVVLTNTDQNQFYTALADEIRDAFLKLPYKGYSEKKLSFFKLYKKYMDQLAEGLKSKAKAGVKNLNYKPYTGVYSNELYGDIEVKLNGTNLELYLSHHPQIIGKLKPIDASHFVCIYTDPTYTLDTYDMPFKIKENKVLGLTLKLNPSIDPNPYEFIKKN